MSDGTIKLILLLMQPDINNIEKQIIYQLPMFHKGKKDHKF